MGNVLGAPAAPPAPHVPEPVLEEDAQAKEMLSSYFVRQASGPARKR